MQDLMIAEKTIPKGYKKSALGVIPEDWEVKTIKEIVDKKIKWSFTGGPFGSNLKADDYTEKGVRIIQLQNIGDGDFLDKYKIYTTIKKADELLSCNIYPGEIILSKMGDPVARACFIPSIEDRFVMSSDGIRLVPDNNIANKFFVLNYINNSVFRAEALKVSIGSTRRRIGLDDLRDLKLPLPSIREQQAIADCLSTWDKAIEKLNQLIAQKELRKKGLMQELLTGKKRFTGNNRKWKKYQLSEMFLERNESKFDNLPLLSIGELGVYPQTDSNKRDISNSDKSKYKRICVGDIGYNTMRMWQGRSALSNYEGIVSPAYTILACRENADPTFFSYLFKTKKLMNLFWRNSQGLVDDTLNCKFKDLSIIKLYLPEKDAQIAISEALQFADKEIQLLKNKLDQLKMQKKGLMQVLLTGKKRLIK